MDATSSVLRTIIERVRALVDEPDLDAKYNDDWLVRHTVYPSWGDVQSRIHLGSENPVLLRFTFTPTAGQEYYQLPPNVQEVWRVAHFDDNRILTCEILPRGEFHSFGPGWALEGSTLALRPPPAETSSESWEVHYVASGHIEWHTGTGTLVDASTVTLDSSPDLGAVDRRSQAYAGCVFRAIPASGVIEERVIESYNPATLSVTLRSPLTSNTTPGSLVYEIVPLSGPGVLEAVVCAASLRLAAIRKAKGPEFIALERLYLTSIKTAMDAANNIQARTGKNLKTDTIDTGIKGWM